MRYKLTLLLIVAFITTAVHAQKITFLDEVTAQPVGNVAIFSTEPSLSTITNARGQADISVFKGINTITIKHVSYLPQTISYDELSNLKTFVLKMSNIPLNEVIISANRWEQQNREVAHRIEKITQREIQFTDPQTAADLLASGGFAYVQKSQLAGGSPILRGFATNRVMLVADGVRMNNAIFRTGNLQNVISLDAFSIQSNEILFGPGAVMYGSDAIGGVMDFHTLDPQLSTNGKAIVTGSATGRFSSANLEKTGNLNFNIGLSKWAFRTSVTLSDFDDLTTGKHGNTFFLRPRYQTTINGQDTVVNNEEPRKQVASGYSQKNVLQRILFRSGSKFELDYGFYYSETSNAPRYDRLYLEDDNGNLANAEWYYGPQKWMMNRLTARYNDSSLFFDEAKIVFAYQMYEESRHDRKMNNARLRSQYEEVHAWSINLDLDRKLCQKTILFYGLEGIGNTVGSTANRLNIHTGEITPTNTRYPDGSTWQSYALYGNIKHTLNPSWIFNAGIRYSYIAVEAQFDNSILNFPFNEAKLNHGAMNGSLGLVWLPSNNVQLYTNLSTGFRSPNIDDIGKVFDSEPGTVVVPNPDLKPEYAYNAELGTAFTHADLLKVNISAFYTYLDNALARRDFLFNGQSVIDYDGVPSKVEAIQNISSAWVYGVQTGVELVPVKGIRIKSKLSYQIGEEQSDDGSAYYPLRHAVPLFGNTHLIYEKHKLVLDLYADYNAGLEYEDLPLSERSDSAPYAKDANGKPYVPAWYTLNFKASWFINRNLSVNAGVENITNQLYRPFASGISAPGFNFISSIKLSF